MLSKKQEEERLEKFIKILDVLPNCESILEISTKTGIPTSTIQRYLNDKTLFNMYTTKEELSFFNLEKADKIYENVQIFLALSKRKGQKKGGIHSQKLNSYSKDENGKFIGSGKNNKTRH